MMLSPLQLEISHECHRGLRQLARDFEQGRAVHESNLHRRMNKRSKDYGKLLFNMMVWGPFHGCNSVHCIGGWLATRRQLTSRDDDRLRDLFYPPEHMAWGEITPKDAARVIRHFLRTGEIKWEQ